MNIAAENHIFFILGLCGQRCRNCQRPVPVRFRNTIDFWEFGAVAVADAAQLDAIFSRRCEHIHQMINPFSICASIQLIPTELNKMGS